MVFTRAGDTVDQYYINRKPTTAEGDFVRGCIQRLGEFHQHHALPPTGRAGRDRGPFNRAIADDLNLATDWSNPATYYLTSPTNYYAAFWHLNGLGGFAYASPTTHENGQSSDCNFIQPTTMTVNMWY